MASDSRPEWRDLLSGTNAGRSLVLVSGVGLHAINIFIATTILPSVVADIGGLPYYAWNTALFVVTSIIGSAASATALNRLAPRGAYLLAVTIFAFGTAACAVAPNMPALLAGRSLQGFGGGMLVALSYAMIRYLFAVALWPRAIALVSGMWGAAALTGPFVGGVFAELGVWRAAFWLLLPLAGGYATLCGYVLGRRAAVKLRGTTLPVLRLILLAAAVLSVSAGSLSANFRWNSAGAAGAAVLTTALAYLDSTSPERLLPRALNEALQIQPHVVEAVVNHASGAAKRGVAGIYNRALYLEERRLALTAWADHLKKLTPPSGNPKWPKCPQSRH